MNASTSLKNMLLSFICIGALACTSPKNLLTKTIFEDPMVKSIASNPDYEVQILYTHVNTKDSSFTSHAYHVDDKKYFYPASTVKMPTAILALQRVHELNREGIDLKITDNMLTGTNRDIQTAAFMDTTTISDRPNIKRYIEKIFAVSDNDAYNRLYELLGQDYINESLAQKGIFTSSAINHRLSVSGYSPEENKHTNPIRFFRDGTLVYDKQAQTALKDWYHHTAASQKGVGYLNSNDSLVMSPFDFSKKNFYSIADMEATIKRVFFPKNFSGSERFDISEEDYVFLKKCMSDLPKTYDFYLNDPAYYDSYVKFFMFGDSKLSMPDQPIIYNKVGDAYGFLIDCAFIQDTSKDIAFFLTAVIHVNKNKIYNDGKYEYDEVGFPFLAKLGRLVYEYELKTYGKK